MGNRSTVPAAKAGILALLKARAGLAGIQVEWSHPGKHIERESVFMASAEFSEETVATMRPKPHRHDEKYTVPVWVDVLLEGDDAQAAEARLWDLVAEVEQAIRDDPSLSGAAGVQEAFVNSKLPDEYEASDQGRGVRCRVGVFVWGRC